MRMRRSPALAQWKKMRIYTRTELDCDENKRCAIAVQYERV